jgi:hypothetical protein
MLHALAWSVIAVLALIWSLLAWPAHALAGWMAANAGALASLPEWIERWTPPAWLAAWVPEAALRAGLAAAAPVLEWTLALVPGLAGWLPPLVLVAWIAGLVVLILAGAACSIAIRLFAGRAHAKL